MTEFTDLITILEADAGMGAIQSTNLCRVRMAGLPGAVAATPLGMYFPVLYHCVGGACRRCRGVALGYFWRLRPAVVALIAGAGLSMLLAASSSRGEMGGMLGGAAWFFSAAFIALRKWKLNPILVMWVCGGVSLAVKLIEYHL